MAEHVMIKSNPNGIQLILDSEIPFADLKTEVEKKFQESSKFFKNAKLVLSFEGRELSNEEEKCMIDIIVHTCNATILCVMDHSGETEKKMQQCLENQKPKETNESGGEFYKGTLRSGQILECASSIVILGDVNPGAKIISKGNIVVLGALRGNAFAGASGDETSFVAALEMDPMQIRIGNTIGRSADKKSFLSKRTQKKVSSEPMIAMVTEQGIMISEITKNILNNL